MGTPSLSRGQRLEKGVDEFRRAYMQQRYRQEGLFVGQCAVVAIDGPTINGVNGEALQNEQLSWPVGGCHDRFTYSHHRPWCLARL